MNTKVPSKRSQQKVHIIKGTECKRSCKICYQMQHTSSSVPCKKVVLHHEEFKVQILITTKALFTMPRWLSNMWTMYTFNNFHKTFKPLHMIFIYVFLWFTWYRAKSLIFGSFYMADKLNVKHTSDIELCDLSTDFEMYIKCNWNTRRGARVAQVIHTE